MLLADLARRLFDRFARSRLLRDSSVLLVANWSATALGLLTSIVVARTLGDYTLGQTIIAATLVTTLIHFMDIRTGEGMIRFMGNALVRGERREAVTFFYVGLSADVGLMAATLVLALIAVPLAAGAYDQPDLIRRLAGIYILTIPFATLEESFSAVLNVFKRFNLLAMITILHALARLAILLTLARYGAAAVMWGHVGAAAFSFLLYVITGAWLLVRNLGTLRGQGFTAAWRKFLPFAFHTSLAQSLKSISENVDVLVLGAVRPPNVTSYFDIARNAANLITTPTTPVSTVVYPEMNEAYARGDLKRIRHLMRRYTAGTLAISGAIYAVLALAAGWLVRVLYGPEFLPAAGLIRILGISVVIQSALRLVRPAAMAANRPQIVTYYGLVSIVVRVLLLVPLAVWLGGAGAALAQVITTLLMVNVHLFYVLPRLGLWRPFGKRAAPPGSNGDPAPGELQSGNNHLVDGPEQEA
jgi:O-antigen/teichoic acid export membrane protein